MRCSQILLSFVVCFTFLNFIFLPCVSLKEFKHSLYVQIQSGLVRNWFCIRKRILVNFKAITSLLGRGREFT